MLKILKEPLLHFLLLGGAIFGLFDLSGDQDAPAMETRIVVSSDDVERLGAVWTQRWQRAPTPNELDGLIEEHIREEVYYREALALGLDRDDVAIRRLLRNKLEFVTQDIMASVEPDPADLVTYYEAYPDRYISPATFSFSQIYFADDKRGGTARSDAELVLVGLRGGLDESAAFAAGEGQMFDEVFRDKSLRDVEAMFGPAFAAALSKLEPGIWAEPIVSGYGLHLVRVDTRREERQLPFADVAKKVRADWDHDMRQKANDDMYRGLRARYTVIVEPTASEQADEGQKR